MSNFLYDYMQGQAMMLSRDPEVLLFAFRLSPLPLSRHRGRV